MEINKAIQTNKDREIIVYSAPTKLQPRHKCRPVLHKTVRRTISQLDADMQSKQWKKRKERKQDKGCKRDGEGRERRLTVCRWLIIVVIWRGFLLTTRPPPPISSLSVHLTDTSLNILAYWSVTIHPSVLSCFITVSLLYIALFSFPISSFRSFFLPPCLCPSDFLSFL